jgi:copper chaperone CopZ
MKNYISLIVLAVALLTAQYSKAYNISEQAAQTSDSIQTVVLKVKGITCSTDLKMICSSIDKLNGALSCKVLKQGPTTTFEVTYNTKKLAENEIKSAIENTASCEYPDERPYKIKP